MASLHEHPFGTFILKNAILSFKQESIKMIKSETLNVVQLNVVPYLSVTTSYVVMK